MFSILKFHSSWNPKKFNNEKPKRSHLMPTGHWWRPRISHWWSVHRWRGRERLHPSHQPWYTWPANQPSNRSCHSCHLGPMDDGNWVESGNSWYSWVLAFGILWLNTFRSSLGFYRPASTYFKQRWFAPRKKSMAVPDGSAFTKELMTIIMVWYKQVYDDSRDKLCLPLPPTPTRRGCPGVLVMIRQILPTWHMASLKST